MNEVSDIKWPCVSDLESLLQRLGSIFTWRDAPVECARLFHDRRQHLLHNYILCKEGILGDVLHHLVRYEAHGRGSLHAHILLWVGEADKARVGQEILGCYPCPYIPVFSADGNTIVDWQPQIPPDDGSPQSRVCAMITRKQVHHCSTRTRGCCEGGRPCCRLFPFGP